MKKQTKTLIILLAVLVVLAAGAFAAKMLTKEPAAEPEAAEDYTVLFSAEAAEITEFSYTAGDEKLIFKNTAEGWVSAEDPEMPLDTDKLAAMVSALTEIRGYKQIDTEEDFGFAENAVEIGVRTSDRAFYCTVGNVNSTIDKAYLMTDDGTIYTTDSVMRSEFTAPLGDLLLADTMPEIDPASITGVNVIKVEDGYYEIRKTEERELYYRFSYVMDNDHGTTPLDDTAVSNFFSTASAPYLTCEKYALTEQELMDFGFYHPAATMTITYTEPDAEGNETEKTYSIDFGTTYTDEASSTERRYVMLKDSEMLFSVVEASAQELLSPDLSALAPGYLAQMDFSELTKFSFDIEGKAHTMLMEKVDEEKVYTLDGKEISSAFLESFFLDLVLMTSEGGYAEELPAEAPVVSAEFVLQNDNGTQEHTLNIYEYNENFCIAEFSGRQDKILVSIRDYNRLLESYAELQENAAR